MEKAYSYDELASILGCTRTAIAKKVKPDVNNPSVERYKERYSVVIKEGKKCILLDEHALEEEKNKSRGFRNVSNITNETLETAENAENTTQPKNMALQNENLIVNVTERYIDKFITYQQYVNEEFQKRDKQILLLTNSENNKQNEYLRTTAENKELKEKYNIIEKKYNVALNVIKGFVFFFLLVLTSYITFKCVIYNVTHVSKPVVETQKEPGQVVTPAPARKRY